MAEGAAAGRRGAAMRGGACGRQAAGLDAGGEAGEPDGHAAQPRPDQQDQRRGEPGLGAAGGDGAAQPLDEAGEAVGRGRGREWEHDRTTNTTGTGLGKRDFPTARALQELLG